MICSLCPLRLYGQFFFFAGGWRRIAPVLSPPQIRSAGGKGVEELKVPSAKFKVKNSAFSLCLL